MEYGGYELERDPTGMVMIRPVGRGSVHKSLRGKFTTHKWAQRAIDSYSSLKGKSNGKAEGTA